MSDDSVIDLNEYLRRRDEGVSREPAATFALWGADGERSRFALPLWRAIYLAGADRGGIVWTPVAGGPVRALVVLDLAKDPARTDFLPETVAGVDAGRAPELVERSGVPDVVIYLGERDERRWYLIIDGGEGRGGTLPARDREDILFLAGECAGLLFLRDFASEAGDPSAE